MDSPVDGVLVPLMDVGHAGGAGHRGVVDPVVGVGVVHGGHAGREGVREGVKEAAGLPSPALAVTFGHFDFMHFNFSLLAMRTAAKLAN